MSLIHGLSTQVTDAIIDGIKNNYLPKLVVYLNDRKSNDDYTIEELEKVLLLCDSISNTTKQLKRTNYNSNKKCTWKYKRGIVKGQYCNKAVVPGYLFCKSCLSRPGLNKRNEIDTPYTSMNINNLPKFEEGSVMINDAKIIDEEQGLYMDIFHNFTLKDNDNNIVVIGKFDELEKKIYLLSEDEIGLVQQRKLIYEAVTQSELDEINERIPLN